MKKIVLFLLSLALAFSLVGCTNEKDSSSNNYMDGTTVKNNENKFVIGERVYCPCGTSFEMIGRKLEDDMSTLKEFCVEFNEFMVIATKKNDIWKEGYSDEFDYYPYLYTIKFSGIVDSKYTGEDLVIRIWENGNDNNRMFECKIEENGNFNFEKTFYTAEILTNVSPKKISFMVYM